MYSRAFTRGTKHHYIFTFAINDMVDHFLKRWPVNFTIFCKWCYDCNTCTAEFFPKRHVIAENYLLFIINYFSRKKLQFANTLVTPVPITIWTKTPDC